MFLFDDPQVDNLTAYKVNEMNWFLFHCCLQDHMVLEFQGVEGNPQVYDSIYTSYKSPKVKLCSVLTITLSDLCLECPDTLMVT